MVESVIMLLIWLAVIAAVIWIVIYALGAMGVAIPPQIIRIVWLIFLLIALLLFIRLVLPSLGVALP